MPQYICMGYFEPITKGFLRAQKQRARNRLFIYRKHVETLNEEI